MISGCVTCLEIGVWAPVWKLRSGDEVLRQLDRGSSLLPHVLISQEFQHQAVRKSTLLQIQSINFYQKLQKSYSNRIYMKHKK